MRATVIIILLLLVVAGGFLAWRAQTQAPATEAAAPDETLYLAIPQGLFVPFNAVMREFKSTHPNLEFMTTVDTPEAMVQNVQENEEKPDIFISPGGHEIEILREQGFIDPDTMVAFGSYDLAILVPADNPGNIHSIDDLLNPEVEVISFSHPDINAASFAARQSLQNLGLWEPLQSKIQVAGCCMDSFRWILDGRAQANVQFLGCPLDPNTAEMANESQVAIAFTFPADSFFVPRNVAGILTTTQKRALAEEFLAFLTSPEILQLMADNRMRNDRNLPLTPGPWGPEQEVGPVPAGAAGS